MKNILPILFLSFFICGFTPGKCLSFKELTHENINKYLARTIATNDTGFNFNDYLLNTLGVQRGINQPLDIEYDFGAFKFREISAVEFLIAGGSKEDYFPRYFNHFHDAYSNRGLWEINESAIGWAQKPFQGYSWTDARRYFYYALTVPFPLARDYELSQTLRALGQVMHLVEDMAVPEHTRNDAHPKSPGVELYVENIAKYKATTFSAMVANPIFFDFKTLQGTPSAFANEGAIVPIANLFDTNIYIGVNPEDTVTNTAGLAEYSNANFLSTDTNPVDGDLTYPYPRLSATTTQVFDIEHPLYAWQTIKRPYYVKHSEGETGGINGYKLSAVDLISYYWPNIFGTTDNFTLPLLDEYVYEDYATLILPRAAGYAATLMNYFFRGEIEISLPDRGIYALASPDGNGFNDIRLKAQNKTKNDEQMPLGTIELVVKYKIAQQDPFQGVPVAVSPEFTYAVIPEKNSITNIPSDHPIELVFDLSGTEIPFWATDLSFQIVYRGQLGYPNPDGFVGEEEGIAVGYKDVSEPTIISYINGMDVACLNDKILVAGSEEALNELDENGDKISSYIDVYPHLLTSSFLKFSPQNNISYASATNYEASIPELYPGHYGQMFIIAEPYGTFELLSNRTNLEGIDNADTFIHWPQTATRFFQGMINQTEYENDKWIQYYSGLTDLRGIKTWAGIFWTNLDYPADTTCYEGNSTIPLMGPDSIELKL